jgi:hypothetical protein
MSVVANLARVLGSDEVWSSVVQTNNTPPATSTLMLSADLHWRRKEWQAAIEAASRVIYREPKDFHALAILVTSHSHLEQFQEANFYARQLVILRPPSWTPVKVLLTLLRSFRLLTAEGRTRHRGIMLKCDEEAHADREILGWARELISKGTRREANDHGAV